MYAVILCGALCCASADEDKLIVQLDADFEELVKKEKDPVPLREAAKLLDQTNQNSRWTSYMDGLAIIRRTRSKAAVPLLLKYMVLHAGYGSAPGMEQAYADALTILTGKDFDSLNQHAKDEVQNLYDEWWQPNKNKIVTDLALMSKEQVQVVAHRMLRQGERRGRDYESDPLMTLSRKLNDAFQPELGGRRTWQPEELDGAMLPVLLDQIGYDANPPVNGPKHDPQINFAVIPMLAALRADGLAPSLEKIGSDNRQSSPTRLTCLLALHGAGEKLNAVQVVAVLNSEKKLECRLAAILALKYSADAKTVASPLLDALDDPNRSVQTAAIIALEGSAPKAALPKLKKVLDELEPPQAVYAAIRTIGLMEGDEPRGALADFMEAAQNDPKKAKYMFQALHAFESATGKNLTEAGAHPEEYYRERAKAAVEWWKTQK